MIDLEKIRYERARHQFDEIQRKKAALTGKDAKLMEQIEAVDVGSYSVKCSVVKMLADIYDNNFVNAFFDMFRLGFMKGQRAERNRNKIHSKR